MIIESLYNFKSYFDLKVIKYCVIISNKVKGKGKNDISGQDFIIFAILYLSNIHSNDRYSSNNNRIQDWYNHNLPLICYIDFIVLREVSGISIIISYSWHCVKISTKIFSGIVISICRVSSTYPK